MHPDMREIGTGAHFSECRRYRYALWRRWSTAPAVLFIGLNPSTADAETDDPTIRRCVGFAKRWGYGALYMGNLFAFRATDPRYMKAAADPVGTGNDTWLRDLAVSSGLIIAAWGAHGGYRNRAAEVVAALRMEVRCLGRTKDGHPRHPLYLRGDVEPEPFPGGLPMPEPAGPVAHLHRCMRCREEFECRNPGQCEAGYDVMPTIIIPSGNTFDMYEHCPMPPREVPDARS